MSPLYKEPVATGVRWHQREERQSHPQQPGTVTALSAQEAVDPSSIVHARSSWMRKAC